MLEQLTFKEEWRCFKVNDIIDFRPGVNLLVGDQGCGKSSLLLMLSALSGLKNHTPQIELVTKVTVKCTQSQCYCFDFEKDNTRMHPYIDGDIGFHIGSMFSSHGQTNFAILKNLEQAKDSVLFFDEPDMALSIRSVMQTIKWFKDAVTNGCQIVASVHHPFLIEAFPEVFSMELRKWVNSKQFIKSQLETPDES